MHNNRNRKVNISELINTKMHNYAMGHNKRHPGSNERNNTNDKLQQHHECYIFSINIYQLYYYIHKDNSILLIIQLMNQSIH